MEDALKQMVMDKIINQATGLLREKLGAALADMDESALRHEGKKTFKFGVKMTSTIVPYSDHAKVGTSISWSTKAGAKTEDETVDLQPDLPRDQDLPEPEDTETQ